MNTSEIYGLLHVADLAKNWPNLRSIHDLAMFELEAASFEAAKELADRKAEAERPVPVNVDELKQSLADINQPNTGTDPETERRI